MGVASSSMTCTLCLQSSGGLTSTPRRHLEEDSVKVRLNPDVYPPRYEIKVVVQDSANCTNPR